ncbi:MAG: hypothetical protein KY429_11705 [Actinobacteria bacterium]|nr:hypothetical protein [Actinomycetota bacterium]
MKDIALIVLGAFGGIGLVLLILFLNPDKVEKWTALFWKGVAAFPRLFRRAKRKYVEHDLQGRINDFTKGLVREAPYLPRVRVKVDWTDETLTRAAFLNNDEVIIRLRREDPQEQNFVHGAYHFISSTLLHKVKRYISQSHRESIDLYVLMRLFEREKPSVTGYFLDSYLHPKAQPDGKVVGYFDAYSRFDKSGHFYPVFLQELDFLGTKVFGGRKDDKIISEVNALIKFLDVLSQRSLGSDEQDLNFCKDYCKFALVIVGKSYKITPTGDVWVNFIRRSLIPQSIDTLYLLGPRDNKSIMEAVAAGVDDTYEVFRRHEGRVVLISRGKHVPRDQFLIVLRRIGAPVFQGSKNTGVSND